MATRPFRALGATVLTAGLIFSMSATTRAEEESTKKEVVELRKIVEKQQVRIEQLEKLQTQAPAASRAELEEAINRMVKSAEKQPPENVFAKVGFGNLRLDGLVQVWFLNDPTTAFGATSTGENSFRLRRGEIALNGDIMPGVGFHIMIDPAKSLSVNQTKVGGVVTNVSVNQNSAILQDLDVRLRFAKMFPEVAPYAPKLEAIVGQQKTPLTEEGYRSSAELDMVERSQLGRMFGDRRSVGVLLKDSYQYADYYVGIFNDGFMLNSTDDNNAKTFAGHLIVKPLPEWKVGVSGQVGRTGVGETDQNRIGFDTQCQVGGFSFKAEYMFARDGKTDSQGLYLQPGLFLVKDKLQLVGRYDWFAPSATGPSDEITEIGACLNWFLYKKNAKMQFEYMRRINQAPPAGVHRYENVFLVALQAAF